MAKFLVEALEKFTVRTVYHVEATSIEEAEEMCKKGKVAYESFSIEESKDEWIETLDSEEMTKQAKSPRVVALFRPQDANCRYIHGAEREFDVTDQVEKMGREEALKIEDHAESADRLYYDQDEFDHNNPFEVEAEEAIKNYFAAIDNP
jgi:hypothetical protein